MGEPGNTKVAAMNEGLTGTWSAIRRGLARGVKIGLLGRQPNGYYVRGVRCCSACGRPAYLPDGTFDASHNDC